jgi:hypothetical protein
MIEIKMIDVGATPRNLRRTLRTMLKSAWSDLGVYWHSQLRAKHFTKSGAREYGYEPRSKRKRGRRKRDAQGRFSATAVDASLPLVFTGISRNRTRIRDVRASSKGVRVVMQAPALNFRPKGVSGRRINLRDEMTRISIGEARTLRGLADRELQQQLNAVRTYERRTIR